MREDMALPKHIWEKESKELRNAIYDDWKRKAIDSAKKRAVAQNVDYPTFANLVWFRNSRCALDGLGFRKLQSVCYTYHWIFRDFGHCWSFICTYTALPQSKLIMCFESLYESSVIHVSGGLTIDLHVLYVPIAFCVRSPWRICNLWSGRCRGKETRSNWNTFTKGQPRHGHSIQQAQTGLPTWMKTQQMDFPPCLASESWERLSRKSQMTSLQSTGGTWTRTCFCRWHSWRASTLPTSLKSSRLSCLPIYWLISWQPFAHVSGLRKTHATTRNDSGYSAQPVREMSTKTGLSECWMQWPSVADSRLQLASLVRKLAPWYELFSRTLSIRNGAKTLTKRKTLIHSHLASQEFKTSQHCIDYKLIGKKA